MLAETQFLYAKPLLKGVGKGSQGRLRDRDHRVEISVAKGVVLQYRNGPSGRTNQVQVRKLCLHFPQFGVTKCKHPFKWSYHCDR